MIQNLTHSTLILMEFRFGKVCESIFNNDFYDQGDEVVTQEKKVVTKLRFIYSCLTNGEEPGDVLPSENIQEEENLEEMWNMNEEITDSSEDEDD